MNRRSFFKSMVGGVAATAAVRTWPFRVFSFPEKVELLNIAPVATSVRFVRMYDILQSRMINRFDILYGFGTLAIPNAVKCASVLQSETRLGLSSEQIEKFRAEQIAKYVAPWEGQVDGTVEHYISQFDHSKDRWIHRVGV